MIEPASHTRRAFVRNAAVLCLFFTGAVLIWSKLRVVSGLPKTAYAEPAPEDAAADLPPITRAGHADPAQIAAERWPAPGPEGDAGGAGMGRMLEPHEVGD